MSSEEWRPIDGVPYEVSNLGRVRRTEPSYFANGGVRSPGGIVNGTPGGNDYLRVSLPGRGMVYVHRLVAEAFVPNPRGRPEVNHLNSDRQDNRAENLEWCNRSENMLHAHENGAFDHVPVLRGESHGRTHLTKDDVREIRRLRGLGESFPSIGRKFDISPSQAARIAKRESWGHVQ